MLVEAQVSSMNTSRSGSRSSWLSNQAARRLRISGRSCSAACAVFFFRVIWCRRQKRPSALTLTCAPFWAKRAFNSGRVMSGTSAKAAWIRSAWASVRRESRSPPCGLGRASPPDGRTGPRRWRPEHESEGRRIALWAYGLASLASRCPESDRPRFGNPDRLHQLEHRSSTTAGLCALFCLWWRRCGAMSSRSKAEHWAQELEAVAGRIAPQFGRAEPRRRALTYLQGLLAPLERKNGWHLA